MFKAVYNLSVSRKIQLIAFTSTFLTLAALCIVSLIWGWQSFKDRKASELVTISRILEINTLASLQFNDQERAQEYVDSVGHEPDVMSFTIFDPDGAVFANYHRNGLAPAAKAPDFEGGKWQDDRLLFSRKVIHGGQLQGSFLIETHPNTYREFMTQSLWVTGALFGAGILISMFFVSRMSSLVTHPIQELVEVTQTITNNEDFSVRALKRYQDEIGSLVEQFNKMLSMIHARDNKLQEINSNLESEVSKRTKDLQARNEELKIAIESANAASKAKSEFLATASHELRTPLNPIIGYVEMLLDDDPNRRCSRELGLIKQSAEQLLRLIDDILDFSRIERGKLSLRPDKVDIEELSRDIIDLSSPAARGKQLTLKYHHKNGIGRSREMKAPLITADTARLRQIIFNLIGNAIKFTHQGSVQLSTSLTKLGNKQANLHIEVVDTGIGISLANQEKLFKPFSQIDSTWSRQFGGMGLGLAISQKIADAFGSRIQCESTEGKGSRFYCDIPVSYTFPDSIQDSEAIPPANGSEYAHGKILLAEDEPVNRELFVSLLTSFGHEVTAACDGQEAIDLISDSSNSFDLLFMDISMPKVDGFQACQTIRKIQGESEHLPIIAMTAHVTDEDKQRCYDAGMDDYLSKPISAAKIQTMIAKWMKPSIKPNRN